MSEARKAAIIRLLKGLQTGDPEAVNVVHPDTYIQHNPQTHTGRAGLAALFARLAKTNPRVNLVRVFSDGDYVFAHTEYDFSSRRIGFEVFRFEGDLTVEHWDNIQPRQGPNASGRSMVDGPTEVGDLARTEANRALVERYVSEVLIARRLERLEMYMKPDLAQHSPALADGIDTLRAALSERHGQGHMRVFKTLHRVLAEGEFVLTVCEGELRGVHTAFYDLYRVEQGLIAEHWDTVEEVAPQAEWKHGNGKF